MEVSKIKETISEAVRLMEEQIEFPETNKNHCEHCDSLCCYKAQMMLEDLLKELQLFAPVTQWIRVVAFEAASESSILSRGTKE